MVALGDNNLGHVSPSSSLSSSESVAIIGGGIAGFLCARGALCSTLFVCVQSLIYTGRLRPGVSAAVPHWRPIQKRSRTGLV
jgi:hypothetical protein